MPNIVGICAESREARIYLFEDTQQNIIFGINDKCVFIEDIVAINWVLVESDEADKDDIYMNDLALIVTELIEKNASRERFHKICFSYNDLN